MSDVEVSDKTSVGLPLRNLIGLASAVAVGTWAWFDSMSLKLIRF
jgi:hypothetical protein